MICIKPFAAAFAGLLFVSFRPTVAIAQPVRIEQTPAISATRSGNGMGVRIGKLLTSAKPVRIVLYANDGQVRTVNLPYAALQVSGAQAKGDASYATGAARLDVIDQWSVAGDTVNLDRRVTVSGHAAGGFATAVALDHAIAGSSDPGRYEAFLPGMVYGPASALSEKAIGRMGPGNVPGERMLQVRQDRLPMPLAAIRTSDDFGLAVLDAAPDGASIKADSENFVRSEEHGPDPVDPPNTLIDSRIRLGGVTLGMKNAGAAQTVSAGYQFPATEAPMTYVGNAYPDAGKLVTRSLYNPLDDHFTQHYRVAWRISVVSDTPSLVRDNWRWAWRALRPTAKLVNIEAARRSLIAQLSSQVETRNGITGITNFEIATPTGDQRRDPKSIMGFTGCAIGTAEYLLWASNAYAGTAEAATYRRQGEAIIASFVKGLKLDPPAGEGFDMEKGGVALAIPQNNRVYLRSFGDDLKSLLRAYRRELRAGRRHDVWLSWARSFGDWLLTQQRGNGSVPRSWQPATGVVVESSGSSSYNAVPMWLMLTELTGDDRYKAAAIRAGEFAWGVSGQKFGRFTGGTIDNPDVIDKEAGTLSLEAYLALFEATHDPRWLERASAAANFAESWIYGWDVPMAVDDNDPQIHWKPGVPTTGVQLIATGHSLVDEYMGFNVDEYAKLYRYTKDPHYFDIARLLLHGTLAMTALPGRTYDLKGPGWQQEHFSLAPVRGRGLHRGWLPWVSVSHLNGMVGLEEFDGTLYGMLASGLALH